MSYLLHIETSTHVCSVAISDNEQILGCKETYDGDHVKHLNPLIRGVLEETQLYIQQLSGVSISNGPGSYTSLRAGMAAAKGICFALDLPLFQISTLEALYYGGRVRMEMPELKHYIPMMDARKENVYLGLYTELGEMLIQPQLFNIQEDIFSMVQILVKDTLIVGNGAQKWFGKHPETQARVLDIQCSATFLAIPAFNLYRDGSSSDLNSCIPDYMKDPNITTPKAKQS